MLLSLSRLNHGLPGSETLSKVVQGTAQFHHEIADALLPQAAPVFDDATALDPARDMVPPQPTLVELLVRHVLLPRALLPQIEINLGEEATVRRPRALIETLNTACLLSHDQLTGHCWRARRDPPLPGPLLAA
jgi:hypothetical protein